MPFGKLRPVTVLVIVLLGSDILIKSKISTGKNLLFSFNTAFN